MKTLDVLFIHPNASNIIYQDLAKEYSAIEPPIWAGLLAQHCRIHSYNPEILDAEAMGMLDEDAVYHIKNMNPRLIVFVVYGQQPSASNQNMEGAVRLATAIKIAMPDSKIAVIGIYASALTRKTLEDHKCFDFACQNEGVYTISDLLKLPNFDDELELATIKGLAFRMGDFYETGSPDVFLCSPSTVVAQPDLPKELPGIAWDLLPMKQYRTALWHSYSNGAERKPFASLYTSLGCPFACTFCCINAPFGARSFRYWEPEFMINELQKLHDMGITNIKIADEMFVLNENHFLRLCELIIARGFKFNIWAYARVDTVKDKYLATLKAAGVNWLALGIESGNKDVRKGVIKGRFEDIDIRSVVAKIRSYNINVIGNYIFGLPDDNMETMQETLDMAMEMCTEEANFYSAMAYPGSQLHREAVKAETKLPEQYAGYSQHSYHSQPLPTKYLTAEQVLKFRDEAWMKYHTDTKFLEMIRTKFGEKAYQDTVQSTQIKLKRKILGD